MVTGRFTISWKRSICSSLRVWKVGCTAFFGSKQKRHPSSFSRLSSLRSRSASAALAVTSFSADGTRLIGLGLVVIVGRYRRVRGRYARVEREALRFRRGRGYGLRLQHGRGS